MRHALCTAIDIEADPETVWRHLADLAAYAEWNPFITSATGSPEQGCRLELRMAPPGAREVTFRPFVTRVSPGTVLEWLGHLGVPGLFDGRDRFDLIPTDDGTHLVQSETFTGLLVRPLRRSLDTHTRAGFVAMNEALRARATRRR